MILTYITIFISRILPNSNFVIILFSYVFLIYYYFYFYLLFVVGKDIGRIYKHSQSQLSTSSFKAPLHSYSDSQTSSSIELTTTSVPSFRDKNQNDSVLCSHHSIHNDVSITNNYGIQSCETAIKKIIAFQPLLLLIIMHNVLLPHPQVS